MHKKYFLFSNKNSHLLIFEIVDEADLEHEMQAQEEQKSNHFDKTIPGELFVGELSSRHHDESHEAVKACDKILEADMEDEEFVESHAIFH